MKGHMQDGKFHPHTEHKKGVRKSRDQKVKTKGVKVERLKRFDRTKIQTLIFPPNWNFTRVRQFLKRNDFKATKVVKEGNRIRARQFPPSDIKRGGDCRTISLGNSSVQAVLCEVPVTRNKLEDVRTQDVRIGNLSKKSNRELSNLLDEPLLQGDDFRFISAELRRRNLGDLAVVKREIMRAKEDGREPRIPEKFVSKMKNEARSCWNGITTPEATQNKLIRMTNLPESDYKCGERCYKGWIQLSTEAKRQMTRAMIISDPELRCFKL